MAEQTEPSEVLWTSGAVVTEDSDGVSVVVEQNRRGEVRMVLVVKEYGAEPVEVFMDGAQAEQHSLAVMDAVALMRRGAAIPPADSESAS